MAKKKSPKAPIAPVENKMIEQKPNPVGSTSPGVQDFMKAHWLKILTILGLALAIYYASFDYGYVLDDTIVIQENNYTKEGFAGIGDIMTSESMQGYFGKQMNLVQGNRYRPLSLVTFAMEYGITGGLHPGLSHAINVLLYAFSGILLFLTLWLILGHAPAWTTQLDAGEKTVLAFVASLIFVAHPLHVEAVANIKGRDEIMAVLFSIWALYYVYKDAISPSRKNLIIASILFLLGLLSKENTITFLAVIPLTVWFFNGKSSMRSFGYLGLTTIVYIFWRFSVSGVPNLGAKITDIMNNPFLEMNSGEKFATVMYTLGQYIKLMIFPHPLTHDYYPYAISIMTLAKPAALISFLLYIGMAIYGFILLKKRALPGYAIWFYLLTLTIVSNLVINLGTFMNDRFVYMPSIAFCLLAAFGVVWLQKRLLPKGGNMAMYGLALIPILAYSAKSFVRVPAWENAVTLNRAAFPTSEGSARANSFMATALFEEARIMSNEAQKLVLLKEALPYAKKAHSILPNYKNANIMLAGVAAEIYRYDRQLEPLLESFYDVATHRPDIQSKTDASGKQSSFLTEYLEYVNPRESSNDKLLAFYKRTLKAMSTSRESTVLAWGGRMAEIARQIAPSDPELQNLEAAFGR